ncbi:hypothetical protein [Clostridium sp. UBA4548]|uniref:hypothetical protein n=1 Tax=Clostridium sp. UBA4548 TaxID=1946361 RepID=UPI0025BDC18E|nr:hypothetical protein [Clostridium sp. UBA4548]
MSSYRILNCGSSMENYYICINEKVAGFTQRTADVGDTIFFSVKYNKKIFAVLKEFYLSIQITSLGRILIDMFNVLRLKIWNFVHLLILVS